MEYTLMKFIFCAIAICLDFWVTKNITGRLLVGYRWFITFDEDGKESYIYQSHDQIFKANIVDKSFFWSGQYALCGLIIFFIVMNISSPLNLAL